MRYAPKIRRYTAFTRGVDQEVVRIPLRAYGDCEAVARAVYQCEGLRQAYAAVRDVRHTMAYILAELTCDDDNGREVYRCPLLDRPGLDPAGLYLLDRDRGWV